MKEVIVRPCAKINLGLNIVSKRSDGYHNLETVFYPIGIFDEIRISQPTADQQYPCEVEVKGIKIDGDVRQNILVKAYDLVAKTHKLPNINVVLTKNIPVQAGLGGGSSDCAFMIKALNDIFDLGISVMEMENMASNLGADCAFFINPQPKFAEGIGDKFSPLELDLSTYSIVVVKPPVNIGTKEAFSHITPKAPKACCKDIVRQPVCTWKDCLVNDFELSIIPQHPEIAEIKRQMYAHGASYSAMSGSGSAVFGIFPSVPKGIESEFKNCLVHVI